AGLVVNVTSTASNKALLLVGLKTASKAAVNVFTESLAIEVDPLGGRLRLVLPGRSPATRFGANAGIPLGGMDHPAYGQLVTGVIASFRDSSGLVTHAS
ncbi:SDR family NAD(P)-dependent oxidoreductase, partial [Stenotrophomonas sp. SrG]|uniref:SDR family NAD(P)-dependent oxidoreductase n=1 Tax=Stenotrophomonas sp. SrG TaxID=3414430 RepID=UPI003CEE2FF3